MRLAAAVAALVLTWVLTRPSGAPPLAAGPRVAGDVDLVRTAATLGRAVYWLGPARDRRTELSVRTDGSVFVRYLPPGTKAGASGALTTVGTYRIANAYAATKGLGAVHPLPNGGIAVVPSSRGARDVYVAFPGADEQIEVFAPAPGAALAAAARVRPVGEP